MIHQEASLFDTAPEVLVVVTGARASIDSSLAGVLQCPHAMNSEAALHQVEQSAPLVDCQALPAYRGASLREAKFLVTTVPYERGRISTVAIVSKELFSEQD